jgi:hypothetical protein
MKVEDPENPAAKSVRVAVSTEEESTDTAAVVDLEAKAAEEKKQKKKVEFAGGKDANHEPAVVKAVDGKNISEDIDPANEVHGIKLILIHLSICLCTFLVGLDFSLIATAVPVITGSHCWKGGGGVWCVGCVCGRVDYSYDHNPAAYLNVRCGRG